MLGELLGESRGKRIVRRALSSDPPKVEVSFEDSGKMLGTDTNGFGTYVAVVRPDGTLFGEGNGAMVSQDGDMISWTGYGLGKFKEHGVVSYRGILFFRTASEKLARLNSVGGVFEYDVDSEGNTHSKVWEWK